jgi:hypothetical protein
MAMPSVLDSQARKPKILNMQTNKLIVDLKNFNLAMELFKVGKLVRKHTKPKTAMLSFNDGFLSIECDDTVSVMRASGEWHGKAQFSSNIVKALTLVPLATNPVVISYLNNKINIGSMVAPCDWESASHTMIQKLVNPSSIDIFAMWRTQPAVHLMATGLKQKNKAAELTLQKATAKAVKALEKFEVTQEELLALIEAKVKARIDR